MNILPKKRWHVRNQDNKERVRRDEENARLELHKEEERIALAEQEARMSFLRQKNNIAVESCVSKEKNTVLDNSAVKEQSVVLHNSTDGHINLFVAEEEAGGVVARDNKEYVAEKKKEKEDYEKKIGLLTYVGQSSVEAKGKDDRPWYLHTKRKRSNESSDSEKEEPRKLCLDPLSIIEKSLKVKKEHKKKKKKKKQREKSPKRSSKSNKSIEELRAKRLKREKEERAKANQLMRTFHDKDGGEKSAIIPESDSTRYSNQFHPDIARKRKYGRNSSY